MKKNLSTCIEVAGKDGVIKTYATVEEAMADTGLTKRQLELRATKEANIKGTTYKWCDSSTRRSYVGRKSRRKGNSWEREVINALNSIGFNCVSSRAESKRTDDAKVDIIDLDGRLPCHIQAKNTRNFPNWHKISDQCPLKDKPFVIALKQDNKEPLAILPLSFLYTLLQ